MAFDIFKVCKYCKCIIFSKYMYNIWQNLIFQYVCMDWIKLISTDLMKVTFCQKL